MIWERLNELACAIVAEKSVVEFALHKTNGSWWLSVHEKTTDEDRISLAWDADQSLANAAHSVEKKLEKRARELLDEANAANRKLSAVLNESDGTNG